MIKTTITPIEIDNQYWVHTAIGGQELQRQGPFQNTDEAEAAARRIAGVCQAIFHSGVVVVVVVVVAPPKSRQEARHG